MKKILTTLFLLNKNKKWTNNQNNKIYSLVQFIIYKIPTVFYGEHIIVTNNNDKNSNNNHMNKFHVPYINIYDWLLCR